MLNVLIADLTCWVLGECDGILLDEVAVETSQECSDACKASSECQWFTFDAHASVCVLLENCPYFETGCTTCVSGQKQCSDRKGKYIYILQYNI